LAAAALPLARSGSTPRIPGTSANSEVASARQTGFAASRFILILPGNLMRTGYALAGAGGNIRLRPDGLHGNGGNVRPAIAAAIGKLRECRRRHQPDR
jgi:hypothetical protein